MFLEQFGVNYVSKRYIDDAVMLLLAYINDTRWIHKVNTNVLKHIVLSKKKTFGGIK